MGLGRLIGTKWRKRLKGRQETRTVLDVGIMGNFVEYYTGNECRFPEQDTPEEWEKWAQDAKRVK